MIKYILIFIIFFYSIAFAEDININKIIQIESNGNSLAYNIKSQARGLMQITPIVLKEYNQYNKTNYKVGDLFNSEINIKIGKWYLEKRIPQMLKYYGKSDTIYNRLISYNAGINYVVKDLLLLKETINYIKKYLE
jgi:soluble lytic murein transglycosylase-like protein